jgi:hypothetical protein
VAVSGWPSMLTRAMSPVPAGRGSRVTAGGVPAMAAGPAQARRLPGLADSVIDQGQHVPGGLQQYGARRGERHPVPAAVQQPGAEDLFQLPDLLAEGWLGDEQPLRGAGEGARVGDGREVPQVPQLKTLRRLCPRWC